MLEARTPGAIELTWLRWISQLPCVVCQHYHGVMDTPAEIHHTDGKTKRDCHLKTIPLCHRHHRHADSFNPPRWISRHGDGKGAFESRYATEDELLTLTRHEVEKLRENHVGESHADNH